MSRRPSASISIDCRPCWASPSPSRAASSTSRQAHARGAHTQEVVDSRVVGCPSRRAGIGGVLSNPGGAWITTSVAGIPSASISPDRSRSTRFGSRAGAYRCFMRSASCPSRPTPCYRTRSLSGSSGSPRSGRGQIPLSRTSNHVGRRPSRARRRRARRGDGRPSPSPRCGGCSSPSLRPGTASPPTCGCR